MAISGPSLSRAAPSLLVKKMDKIKLYIGEIIFTAVLLLILVLYMADVYEASSAVENLLMIFPIGAVTLVLFALAGIALIKKIATHRKEDGKPQSFGRKELKIVLSMVIYALYTAIIMFVGFDAGTFLFIIAMLLLQGERSLVKLIAFPLIFSVIASFFFSLMIPYPMPMLLNFDFLNLF